MTDFIQKLFGSNKQEKAAMTSILLATIWIVMNAILLRLNINVGGILYDIVLLVLLGYAGFNAVKTYGCSLIEGVQSGLYAGGVSLLLGLLIWSITAIFLNGASITKAVNFFIASLISRIIDFFFIGAAGGGVGAFIASKLSPGKKSDAAPIQ